MVKTKIKTKVIVGSALLVALAGVSGPVAYMLMINKGTGIAETGSNKQIAQQPLVQRDSQSLPPTTTSGQQQNLQASSCGNGATTFSIANSEENSGKFSYDQSQKIISFIDKGGIVVGANCASINPGAIANVVQSSASQFFGMQPVHVNLTNKVGYKSGGIKIGDGPFSFFQCSVDGDCEMRVGGGVAGDGICSNWSIVGFCN